MVTWGGPNLGRDSDKLSYLNKYVYGCCGMYSCIYYNLYTACTTTTQGKSCNSAAALFFESFLNNNVPMGSMNELVTFIHNVITEARFYDDKEVLDRDITIEECFYQLMSSTGWGWIPSEEEMKIIWDMLANLGQEDLNRLFYKNNLFNFIDNSRVKNAILNFLCKLNQPYMDPNLVPEEAADELKAVTDLIQEYVYYRYQIIDRLDKMYYLVRSNSIIQDRIVSLYRAIYIANFVNCWKAKRVKTLMPISSQTLFRKEVQRLGALKRETAQSISNLEMMI